jgi:hypothetical protein
VLDQLQARLLKETNWLVTVCFLDRDNPSLNIEDLDWIGRVVGFAYDNNARIAGLEVEDEDMRCIELWFAFLNDEDKKKFLDAVREDDYCDPDDEVSGFHKPKSLDCVAQLVGPGHLFHNDEYARIMSSGHLAEKTERALREQDRLTTRMLSSSAPAGE